MKPLTCDVLIEGGWVIDGAGGPGVRADVAVVGDRLAPVGEVKTRIDARHPVVGPGFIDARTMTVPPSPELQID